MNSLWVKWGLLGVAICSSGCTATIEGQSLRSNPEQAREIVEKCRELKKIGNVAVLSDKIDTEMEAIEEILERADPTKYEVQIKTHAERVRSHTGQLIEVLNSDYAKLDYTQVVRWTITSDFDTPVSAKVEKAIIWNGEDEILAGQFDIKVSRSEVRVQLVRPASLIELCQLERMMNVILSVTYKDDWGSKATYKYRLKIKGK